MYEVFPIIDNVNASIKNSWEQTRNIMYSVVQSQSSKKLKPTDILKLPWDAQQVAIQKKNKQVKITKEYVEQMKQMALAKKDELIKKGILNK